MTSHFVLYLVYLERHNTRTVLMVLKAIIEHAHLLLSILMTVSLQVERLADEQGVARKFTLDSSLQEKPAEASKLIEVA